MYKGKDFGTPFKKRGCGVRCLVAFEIRSGSYRVSPAKPGEKKFSATYCRTYYMWCVVFISYNISQKFSATYCRTYYMWCVVFISYNISRAKRGP